MSAVISGPPAWHGTGGNREPAERLAELARAIGRLSPDWQRPERFFEMRSELAAQARKIARAVECG
jgi:hypothetical protein